MAFSASLRVASATLAVALAVGPVGAAGPAEDGQFRVENKVFSGGEKEPKIRSTTIFQDGVVYDFLEEPAEVTVFDNVHGRFVLLDLKRRIRTELTAERVADFTGHLKRWSQGQSDPFLRSLGAPHLEEEFDEASGQLSLRSPSITYELVTVEADPTIVRKYREFADWSCQLNTLLTPRSRPPFARMVVNEALQRHGRFAREVHLTLKPKKGPLAKHVTARSEHLLVRHLVESDRRRVAEVDRFMALFTAVRFNEYQERVAE
jgi:hypothetical protein